MMRDRVSPTRSASKKDLTQSRREEKSSCLSCLLFFAALREIFLPSAPHRASNPPIELLFSKIGGEPDNSSGESIGFALIPAGEVRP